MCWCVPTCKCEEEDQWGLKVISLVIGDKRMKGTWKEKRENWWILFSVHSRRNILERGTGCQLYLKSSESVLRHATGKLLLEAAKISWWNWKGVHSLALQELTTLFRKTFPWKCLRNEFEFILDDEIKQNMIWDFASSFWMITTHSIVRSRFTAVLSEPFIYQVPSRLTGPCLEPGCNEGRWSRI